MADCMRARVGIEDAGDLGVRVLRDAAQEVAHVNVVEADPEHAVPGHLCPLPKADLPHGPGMPRGAGYLTG